MNSLCQDDKYTINVQFGVRASDSMDYNFQQIVTAINGTAEVASSILVQEYCYRAVLSNRNGRIIAGIFNTILEWTLVQGYCSCRPLLTICTVGLVSFAFVQ